MTVSDLAARAAMSPRTFARRFLASTGTTPLAWIVRERIGLAQRLLGTSDLPTDVIARESGFGSPDNLRKHFGRALRTTPQAYRQAFLAVSAGGVGLLALLVRHGGGHLSRQERLAVTASVGGLVLLGLSLPGATPHTAPPGWAAPLGWVLISVFLAAIAAFPAARLLRPGAGLAVAAGLLYSAGDVATKAAVGGTSPALLFAALLPACHGLAFAALQMSFQRGTAMATAGVSSLLTNVLPILAGLTIFAEHMPGGVAGILRGLGFAGAVLGAALLAATGPEGGPSQAGDEHPASPGHGES